MSRELTVRRLIIQTLVPVIALLLVMGVAAAIAIHRTNGALRDLTDEIHPMQVTVDDHMQLMTDAETALRGWAISGNDSALDLYREALRELPRVTRELRSRARRTPELEPLVEEQIRAGEEWFESYGRPRLKNSAGLGGYDPQLFDAGKAAFDTLRRAEGAVQSEIEEASGDAQTTAERALRRVLVLLGVLTLLGVLAGMWLARRVQRLLGKPLADLEEAVAQVAAGRLAVRAQTSGPREVAAVARTFNVLADANERGQAVEEQTRRRLIELDQAKSDFVSNVSHELRTPLTSISGYLELLEDSQPDIDPESRRMWEIVNRNVTRLSVLVGDLLTMANLEARHTTLTEIDLRDAVIDVITDLRIAAANKDVDLRCDAPTEPLLVLADSTQVLRAILNVVSNGVKFARTGGEVVVDLSREGDEAVLTVRDNGIGIPADELSNLGGRFFRGSNAVKLEVSGTGLGVRMVQTIIGKHGGTVSFESVENEHTTVTIRLPLRFTPDTGAGEQNGTTTG